MNFRICISLVLFLAWVLIIFYAFNTPKLQFVNSSILKGKLNITIDEFGIGSIEASNRDEAFFGLGYLHAKDRLLQLFITKAFSTGTLSENLGSDFIEMDKTILNFRFDENIEFIEDNLDKNDLKALDSYVNGINEYVNNLYFLPLEFYLIGIANLPAFKVRDVIAIYKITCLSMSSQWSLVPLRTSLAKVLGSQLALEILPVNDPNVGNDKVYSTNLEKSDYRFDKEMDQMKNNEKNSVKEDENLNRNYHSEEPLEHENESQGKFTSKMGGSNSWTVNGNFTKSGMPLLAGDPHLGTNIPSFFYLSKMKYGNLTIQGATVPGTPVYVIGRNNKLAFTCTMSMVESISLYNIQLNYQDSNSYIINDQSYHFNQKEYIIKVKNSSPVHFVSNHTVHGPFFAKGITAEFQKVGLIAEAYSFKDPVAFSWGAFERTDSSFIDYLNVNQQTSTEEFVKTNNKIHYSGINLVFASDDGTIGSMVLDDIVKRNSFHDHLFVRNGSNLSEKIDYNIYGKLYELNPSKGYIVSCNNKLSEKSAGSSVPEKARAQIPSLAIAERINSDSKLKLKLTEKDMMDIQFNISETHASKEIDILIKYYEKYSQKVFLENSLNVDELNINYLIAGLKSWNRTFYTSSKSALLFYIWRHLLTHDIFNSILEKQLAHEASTSEISQIIITNFILNLENNSNIFVGKICKISNGKNSGDNLCPKLVVNSFIKAIDYIEKELGKNQKYWQFGYLHLIKMKHNIFGDKKVPGLLKLIFNRELPSSGSHSSVKKGGIVGHVAVEVQPVMRIVADLSDFNATWYTLTPGQSSNILSLNYDNLFEKHEYGHYMKISENRKLYTINILGE